MWDRIYLESCYMNTPTKYLASIIDDSVIILNEILAETKTVPTNFSEKKATCKTQNFYILFAFLLITKSLLVAVSIYCLLIEYWVKQKYYHFLSQITN